MARFLASLWRSRPKHSQRTAMARRAGRSRVCPPRVEVLEDRLAPSVYTVNALTDTGAGSGQTGDLRYCVNQSNANPGQANTITFAASLTQNGPATVSLGNSLTFNANNTTTILGPGANLLTVDGGNQGFTVFVVNPNADVALNGLTIADGGQTGEGGGVYSDAASLTISNCTLAHNSSGQVGGIFDLGGTLTVSNSTLVNNSAASFGGGIFNGGGHVTVSNSTLSGNSSTQYGGGIYSSGTLSITQSTLSGNTALTSGGGIMNDQNGVLGISDSTLTGNSVTYNLGGGIDNSGNATATIGNSTFSNNSAPGSDGGGIWNFGVLTVGFSTLSGDAGGDIVNTSSWGGSFSSNGVTYPNGSLNLSNSILGNSVNAADLVSSNGYTYTFQNNLIQTESGNVSGGGLVGDNPDLSPLGSYGGPTATFTPLAGSPVFSESAAFQTCGGTDASQTSIAVSNPALLGVGPNTVVMIDSEQMLVTAVNGNTLTVQRGVNGTAAASHTNGASVSLATDQRGLPRGTGANAVIGAFQSQPLVVNTTADGTSTPFGTLDLRQAINVANVLTASNGITFDSTVFATPQTITLGGTELPVLVQNMTVTGPSIGVTVSGAGLSRVFEIGGGSTANVTISNLTITQGHAGGPSFPTSYGGGVFDLSTGTVTLSNCNLTGNSAGEGGGFYSNGTAVLNDCTISDNTAQGNGGGVANDYLSMTLTNCTVAGNSDYGSGFGGGGVFSYQGTITITNCTIADNSANGPPGGGFLNTGQATLNNTIVAGNTASGVESDILTSGPVVGDYNLTADDTAPGSHSLINANPLLAPLGNYGGTTQTMPLLPGSPALDAGSNAAASGITTDQRGQTRITNGTVDIGAFESQGFTLSVTSGSGQSTPINTAFGQPLVVTVASAYGEPVAGGLVTFAAPGSGASASLSGSPVTLAANGQASATATANGVMGPNYTVTASAAGAGAVGFTLSNTEVPSLVVTTTADVSNAYDGQTSLREALAYANSAASGSNPTVTFAAGLSGSITVTGGQLEVSRTGDPTTNTVTIDATGHAITIDGNHATRIFQVDSGVTAALTGLTIANGSAPGSDSLGGGILNYGVLTVSGSTLSGNSAQGGGAINNAGGGTLTVSACTFSGDSASAGGGILNAGAMEVSASTFSDDSATPDSGGGIYNNLSGTATVSACTFNGDTAGKGGGIFNYSTLTVSDSTFSGNSAVYDLSGSGFGGGIENWGYLALGGSIVAGNTATFSGPEVDGGINTDNGYNLVGGDALLAPLGNYGGPTQTLALLPGSPALDAGDPGDTSADQRGVSVQDGRRDIGAFESHGFTLSATSGSGQTTQVNTAFANPLAVSVTSAYLEPVAGGLVTFTAPASGASASLTGTPATIGSDGQASVTATANGVIGPNYTVTASASGAGAVDFTLSNTEVPSLVVTTTADVSNAYDGQTSLREAIAYASSLGGTNSITFSPGLSGTITLGNALPQITDNLIIQGPGANVLTVSGNNQYQVFTVGSGVSDTIAGLTISGGNGTYGGDISNEGTLALNNDVIGGGYATFGGGIFAFSASTLVLNNDTVSGNTATNNGGGIFNEGPAGTATISNSTISGNSAFYNGGIGSGGTLAIVNSTVSGNTASYSGGGIGNSGPLTVISCTISGNSAPYFASGIDSRTTVSVQDTIIAGNTGAADFLDYYGGMLTDRGYNLIGNGGPGWTGPGDILNPSGSLDLGPLQNNGGPTQTMALLPGSPALDAGNNALAVDAQGNALTTDQRGQPRVSNGTVDIGAFESHGFTITVNGSGQSTPINTTFIGPLVITVSSAYGEPVAGGTVTLTVPTSGATASLSAASVTLPASGHVSIAATANSTLGSYTVSVSAGSTYTTTASLTNLKAVPTLTTTPGGTVVYGGGRLTDSATLSSGYSPTGTITFTLYAPNGTIVDTETASVNGNGTYSTPNGDVPAGVGTYQWLAQYSGDSNNHAVSPSVATTAGSTLTGLYDIYDVAIDASGNRYVAESLPSRVAVFAPGSTSPTSFLTGVSEPTWLGFDPSGDLFVVSAFTSSVWEFAPGSTTPTATLTGVDNPQGLPTFDAHADLFITNAGNNTVSEYAPGSTSPTATLAGLTSPGALAVDSSGDLFVCNGNTVSEFAPGSTSPTATLTGLSGSSGLAFDAQGDLFVSNGINNTVSEFAPGAATPTATLTGLSGPSDLGFDSNGDLFVLNGAANTVSEFAPASTTPTATLTGLDQTIHMAFDGQGNLYVVNYGSASVSAFSTTEAESVLPATPTVTVSDGGTYNGSAFDAVGSAVGIDGQTPVSGSFSYTYYASDGVTQLSGAPTNAGSYYVVAAFTSSDANYANASSPETSFSIGQVTLTVTANDAIRVYGQANPTFTDTITGFVGGDSPSVVSGAASLTTTATPTSAPGNYTIVAAQGTLSAVNYTFAFVNGTLTVYPLPTAGLSGPSDGVAFQPRIFGFTANGAAADVAAGFTYSINWGDGSPVQVVPATANDTSISATHAYASTGTFTVSVTATDQYNATSNAATQTIKIALAEIQSDSAAQGGITGLAVSDVGGSAGDVFAPGTTAGTLSVTVNGVAQGTFTPTAGTVVVYGDGGSDLVTVKGVASSTNTFTLAGNTATFTAKSLGSKVFTFGLNSISSITLQGGSSNTFTNTVPTVASVLVGGTSVNQYVFTGAGMGAPATIQGAGSSNTLTGANIPNTWNVTGSNAGNLNGASWSFTGVQNLAGGSQGNNFVFSNAEKVAGNVNGGTGGGTVDLSAYSTAVSLNLQTHKVTGVGGTVSNLVAVKGGSGSNTLTGANVADTFTITSTNAGSVNGTLAFTAFANLTGGTASNDFVFSDGQGVTGKITGIAGVVNRLDYTAYSAGIYANLNSKVATGTGGISNINQVFGGNGNDILVGAGSGILLEEAVGNNLIIGGSGQATIQSGSGQDIVIAGNTSYDTNQAALTAIENFWSNLANGSFITRVATLSEEPGITSNRYRLSATTVTHAAASDTLTLGSATDWAFWRLVGTNADLLTGTPEYSTYI